MLDLMICSVSFNSSEYLRLNRQLSTPTCDWLVLKNNPKDIIPTPDFIVLDGTPRPEQMYDGFIGTASFHHAATFNKACVWLKENCKSRYILFLDPDFFIIPSLDKCINHMMKNNLAFFGAPYTIDLNKPRIQEFPVAFCMFVDTQQVDIGTFDFTPTSEPNPVVMKDTGYKIYSKYALSYIGYEAVLPSYDKDSGFKYTNKNILNTYGLHSQQRMDQYFWNDKLFGLHFHAKLHLRNEKEVAIQSAMQTNEVKKIIKYVRSIDDSII